MKYYITSLILIAVSYSQTFEVQNVTASQRTDGSHILDVCYDLSPDDLFISFRVTAEINIDSSRNNFKWHCSWGYVRSYWAWIKFSIRNS